MALKGSSQIFPLTLTNFDRRTSSRDFVLTRDQLRRRTVEMLERLGVLCICLVLALFLPHGTAAARTVYGQNSYLSGGQGGLSDMFIPIVQGAGGRLGSLTTDPGYQEQVGLFGEVITLAANGTAAGQMDFVLEFDISELLEEYPQGFYVDPTDANTLLRMDLYNIDFKRITVGKVVDHWEWLEVTLFQDVEDMDKSPNDLDYSLDNSLLIHEVNYQDYIAGDPGNYPETDGATIPYSIKLSELIDPNDVKSFEQDVAQDGEFAIGVRFVGWVTNNTAGPIRVLNISEGMNCWADVAIVPEPGAMILLTCGAAALLLRRRR